MTLLPFDPFSPRVLSLVLLAMIILVTKVDHPAASSMTLVRNDSRSAPCAAGYVPSASANGGWGCGSVARNSIGGGKLMVGTSF